jgi:ribosomal protein L14E/L6E/L27E
MHDITVGQVVFSKAGRDKGHAFIVIDHKEPFVYLCDGKLRRLENPKKKKDKHIQTTGFVDKELMVILENQSRINNADIRKSLSQYFEEVTAQP